MTSWFGFLMATDAKVCFVANRASISINAACQAMPCAPPEVIVGFRFFCLVAFIATILTMTDSTPIFGKFFCQKHGIAVRLLPAILMALRAYFFANLLMARTACLFGSVQLMAGNAILHGRHPYWLSAIIFCDANMATITGGLSGHMGFVGKRGADRTRRASINRPWFGFTCVL
jgi:hypothetical protein